MNERDSEIIYSELLAKGYQKADSVESADIVLLNTCSVRKQAEDRAFGNAWILRGWKKKNPDRVLGIVGCMAQNLKENILKKLTHVDFVCGPSGIYEIPKIIDDIISNKKQVSCTYLDQRPLQKIDYDYRETKTSTFVNIAEGCNNFCSYCIVPFVRGREVSRPMKDVIDEIKGLVDKGFKEVMLLGQNVNSYSQKSEDGSRTTESGMGFVGLLEKIDKINDLERIRFMTSHPKDASEDLFKAMRDLEKVCEHLHLPLQSGSDKILKCMNRKYTAKHYLNLVDKYRKIVKDGSLTTDIIVGFPGEREGDFKKTYSMMKKISFDAAFIFKYSPRPPASACALKDDVETIVKLKRNHILLELQEKISLTLNKKLCNKTEEILIEDYNKSKNQYFSRTRTNKTVVLEKTPQIKSDLIGKLFSAKIIQVKSRILFGKLLI